LLASLGVPARTPAQGGPVPIFTAYCNMKGGVAIDVAVNGVTTERSIGQELVIAQLNSWLRAGKNQLRVRTRPGAKIAEGAEVKCEVVRSIPRKPPVETVLARLTWPAGAKATGRLDRTLEISVPGKDAPPCELWKRAEKMTLDAPTRAAVLKKVGELEEALRTANVARVVELQRFSSEDWVKCNGKDLDEFRRWAPEQARAIVEVLAPKKFAAWDPARAKVELVAGGRVAQVTVDGGPPIVVVGTEKDDRSTIQPFVARIDGAFVLVR
jgi:hypothetical protein